eukprot:m.495093 g.495093  ORF g.495093 m.495093 type:complete len:51 (-) comp43025_c0_seq1:267-419(-)
MSSTSCTIIKLTHAERTSESRDLSICYDCRRLAAVVDASVMGARGNSTDG